MDESNSLWTCGRGISRAGRTAKALGVEAQLTDSEFVMEATVAKMIYKIIRWTSKK